MRCCFFPAAKRGFVRLASVLLFVSAPAFAHATVKDQCFDLSSLSPELRSKSEMYLLKALDTEHLFTLVTGLKPMSGGFYDGTVSIGTGIMTEQEADQTIMQYAGKKPAQLQEEQAQDLQMAKSVKAHRQALQEVEDVRRILSTWRCGDEIHADLAHYATTHGGKRHLQGVIFSLPALKNTIAQKQRFFSRWAITPHSNPLEVLMAVEYARDTSRFAGYGYLFGYPDPAVMFFASALASEDTTGNFVRREFRAIPTFERETGQFTYAVPQGSQETDEDRRLRARAEAILEAYKQRRARYIGPGKPGAAALLRDWFCTSDNHCSPANAAL